MRRLQLRANRKGGSDRFFHVELGAESVEDVQQWALPRQISSPIKGRSRHILSKWRQGIDVSQQRRQWRWAEGLRNSLNLLQQGVAVVGMGDCASHVEGRAFALVCIPFLSSLRFRFDWGSRCIFRQL
jgi:hypothetical protein